MRVIVYLPALNEAETIGGVLDAIPSRLQGIESIRAIVVDDPESLKGDGPVIVMACSTKDRQEADQIPLPNQSDEPQTRSGLKKPCWAIPRWHFPIEREPRNWSGSVSRAFTRVSSGRS